MSCSTEVFSKVESCRKILQQGLQELKIKSDENSIELLLAFIKLIEKWNKTYNLTAVRDRKDMASLHILDSLTILPYVQGCRVADIGTGAGLPGIPLAVFLPEVEFTLLDSNSKKTRFVQQVILELKLKNVNVIHSRAEKLQPVTLFSTVIMRAFSSLQDIMLLSRHLIAEKGILLAMKGQQPDKELSEISQAYSIIPIHVPGVEAERCLIRIEGMTEHG